MFYVQALATFCPETNAWSASVVLPAAKSCDSLSQTSALVLKRFGQSA